MGEASQVYAITGGSGSLGTALTHALLAQGHKVRTISRGEHKIAALEESVSPALRHNLSAMCGDVRSPSRLRLAFRGVDYVIHAAALKGVGRCEYDPGEAVLTNIEGTVNVALACLDAGVKRAVFISSDKACSPHNLYGMTKACGERLWLASNSYSAGAGCEFMAVRYGNCFGSAGSVYHMWKSQSVTGTIAITDPECTRFNFRVPDAVAFVLEALREGETGTIRVPILPTYRLKDFATAFAPDAKREYVGMRPGEKLHELMVNEHESVYATKCKGYWTLGRIPVNAKRFEYSSGTSTWRMTIEDLRNEVGWFEGVSEVPSPEAVD